ncbi:MAG: CBS domain-containing protein [Candidatus Omnitrophica bacterium]|nr:CBS domain-containing protein [Candidatus Omnitrophota bacterium]
MEKIRRSPVFQSMMPERPINELLKEKTVLLVTHKLCVQGSPDIPVEEAMELMRANKSGYIVLVEGEKPVGIFTETDVVLKVLGQPVDRSKPVRNFMLSNPQVLTRAATVGEAIDLMAKNRIYHIPIVDEEGRLAGIISVRSVIKFLAEFYPTEVYNLPPDPDQIMRTAEGG